jgi:hypothetical protein
VYLLKYYNAQSEEIRKNTIGNMVRFTSFVDVLNNKNKKLILSSVKYMHDGMLASNLIEELLRLIRKDQNIESRKNIGEIFIAILDKATPTFKEENIREIIETLYSTNNPKIKKTRTKYATLMVSEVIIF